MNSFFNSLTVILACEMQTLWASYSSITGNRILFISSFYLLTFSCAGLPCCEGFR